MSRPLQELLQIPKQSWKYLFLLCVLGLGIRIYDLTDPPLDISSTRQLRSAIVARSLFIKWHYPSDAWQYSVAEKQITQVGLYEPPITETLAAGIDWTLGDEHWWIGRILASLFWVFGGIFLYMLARRFTSSYGATISLLYYLFLPFSIIQSRLFQPDALMVASVAAGLWGIHYWLERRSWKSMLLAGFLAGFAILVKPMALFFIGVVWAFQVFWTMNWRAAIKNRQVWGISALIILVGLFYYLIGMFILKLLTPQIGGRIFLQMWFDPAFYASWGLRIAAHMGVSSLILGGVGLFLLKERQYRATLAGLWFGYVLYGMTFSYYTLTHAYYQLILVLIIALAIAPISDIVARQILKAVPDKRSRFVIACFVMLGVMISIWNVRVTLVRDNYRAQPEYWRQVTKKIPGDANVIGLTQDYGMRAMYFGWIQIEEWPTNTDNLYSALQGTQNQETLKQIQEQLAGHAYFLVTRMNAFNKQKYLKAYLDSHYPIWDEGDGYVVYNLQVKK